MDSCVCELLAGLINGVGAMLILYGFYRIIIKMIENTD